MLITNSTLVISHNLIHKYKHALLNKSFKFFISKKETQKHYNIYMFKKTHELQEIENEHKLREKSQNKKIVLKNVKKKAYMGKKMQINK